MPTKLPIVIALFFGLTAASLPAISQTYQWKDSNGQTVISDVPPPSTAKSRRAIGARQPSVVSEKIEEKSTEVAKAPDEPKTMAEKDLEFKKRQQEAREKAEKQAKEQQAERDKTENCERARRSLAALEANQPMASVDENGQRRLMDATQRAQEMERARRFVSESCK